jgi:hypothetical protein
MEFRKPFLTALSGSALLFAAVTYAQTTPPPPAEMAQPMPSSTPPPPAEMAQPMPSSTPPPPAEMEQPMPSSTPQQPSNMPPQTGSTTMPTPAGDLTVHSSMPQAPPAGPAPTFEQLSGGGKSISEDQAAAYPLLANDFIFADHNRNKSISKSEYQNWLSQK